MHAAAIHQGGHSEDQIDFPRPDTSPVIYYLEGAATRQTSPFREHFGPRAVLNALERLANAYRTDRDQVRQVRAIAKTQLRDYQARLGMPFAFDNYLSEMTSLRDQLKASQSATAHDPSQVTGPSVSELAKHIKALKAGNSIDTTSQHAPAESCDRRGANHSPHPPPNGNKPTIGDRCRDRRHQKVPPESAQNSLSKAMSIRERILCERQFASRRPPPL